MHVADLGSILFMLVVLLILARVGSRVFARFGLPGLIGEIIVGIIIANIVFGDWSLLEALDIVLPEPGGSGASKNYEFLFIIAELGVIFLLFTVGLETKVKDLLSVGRSAMMVAILGVLLPFICGFALIYMVEQGGNIEHAMFMGAAMVATSVGITARIIKDMKLLNTKEAKIIIGAAVIDDILGMIILAIAVGMVTTEGGGMSIGGILSISISAVLFVLVIMFLALKVVPKVHDYYEKRNKATIERTGKTPMYANKLILAIVVCFGLSWLADAIGLAAIIGAFLGGMLLADYAWEWKLEEKMESITSLFISFFFLNVGMQVDLGESANAYVIGLSIVVVVLAIVSKYLGCYWGSKIGEPGISKDSSKIIGIGMVPRGEVGIIVASMGLAAGAMSSDLYTVIVVMAVVTTIIAPPFLAKSFRKKYPEDYAITPEDTT